MRENSSFSETFLHAIIDGEPIPKLIDRIAEAVGNPVALEDFSYHDIAFSSNYPEDDMQDRLNRVNNATEEDLQASREWMIRTSMTGKPQIGAWSFMRRERLFCGCLYKGNAVAFLRFPRCEKPLKELDYSLIEWCAHALATAVVLSKGHCAAPTSPWLHFLWGALSEGATKNYLQYPMDQSFMEELPTYRIIYIPENKNPAFSIVPLSSLRHCHALHLHNGIAAIISGDDRQGLQPLHDLAEEHNLTLGISDVFFDLHEIRTAFTQAQQALFYAQTFGESCGLLLFDHFRFYQWMQYAADHIHESRLSNDMPECLTKISNYDSKKGTDYLNTIKAYLFCNCNAEETAQKLFIHKNTIFYRITRIKELFSLDLSNFSTCATLWGAFVISSLSS